ncbi:MAG TPA: DUF1566 domain-containing protein [Sediminibacterium sp.]|nr:DUF1566 domain-containing protein [Sediminibacterium sp.]
MKKLIIITLATSICCSLSAQKKVNASIQQTASTKGKYPIVHTGQAECFNNNNVIEAPVKGSLFYGQDAQFKRNEPSYLDNKDGTITDRVTGLMWQKGFGIMNYAEALEKLKEIKLAGYNDWRLPTIKEAYSLILFSGVDVNRDDLFSSNPKNSVPFIDTFYFDFNYASNGNRSIDVQMLTSTFYNGLTIDGLQTVFGLNIADGRIKGYPLIMPVHPGGTKISGRQQMPPPGVQGGIPIGQPPIAGKKPKREAVEKKLFTVRFVRGNTDYGKNIFKDNSDNTITDLATNLMWTKEDSKKAMNWEDALAFAQQKNKEAYLGYNDWRLPNAKELQSIVDYRRSIQRTNSAAIDPLFNTTEIRNELGQKDFPWFWTSTTHKGAFNDAAVYICFGSGLGYMPSLNDETTKLIDVHGAGSQRSDPKSGDPKMFSKGRGPQGDVIRIHNYVRLVRNIN